MNQFLYDIHVHTRESSLCGHIPGEKLIEEYGLREYAGIAITDHLNEENIQALNCRDDWQACMDHFLTGYKAAKAAGDAAGMDVILGAEIRFPECDSDFLLFGIDEEFLRGNPYLYRTKQKKFFKKYNKQLLMIAAHPYRAPGYPVYPKFLHGLEIVNCNERHANHNDVALALAQKHKNLYRLCSSDTHRLEDVGRAALVLSQRVTHSHSLSEIIQQGSYELFCPEYHYLLQ